MKRLLVTGGSGDVGRVVCQRAEAAGYEVVATYLTRPERILAGLPAQLDLGDRDALAALLEQVVPDVIVHTAVPPLSAPNLRQNIVTAAFNLSRLVPKHIPMIFLSSDMVFDGLDAPYRDDHAPSPLSQYGQAKAEMEMIGESVVRTSLVYDFAPGNRQVDWMLERLTAGERVKLYADEYRSPIWADNLANALLELSQRGFKGILNVAGPEPLTRLELGWHLLEAMGYDAEPLIEAVSGVETGRPPDLTLDVGKATLLLKTPLLTVEEAAATWRAQRAAAENQTADQNTE